MSFVGRLTGEASCIVISHQIEEIEVCGHLAELHDVVILRASGSGSSDQKLRSTVLRGVGIESL